MVSRKGASGSQASRRADGAIGDAARARKKKMDARQRGPHRDGRQREHGDIDQEQTVEAVGERRARVGVEQVAEQADPDDGRARRPALHPMQRDEDERQHDQGGDILSSHRRRQGVLGVEPGNERPGPARDRGEPDRRDRGRVCDLEGPTGVHARVNVQASCRPVNRIPRAGRKGCAHIPRSGALPAQSLPVPGQRSGPGAVGTIVAVRRTERLGCHEPRLTLLLLVTAASDRLEVQRCHEEPCWSVVFSPRWFTWASTRSPPSATPAITTSPLRRSASSFARGAPTKPLVDPLLILYDLLTIAFGVGVWLSARGNRPLRVAAASLIAVGAIGLPGPWLFPMNLRGVGGDAPHIVVTGVIVLFILTGMGFGAFALGRAVPRLLDCQPGRDARVRRADQRPGQRARHRRARRRGSASPSGSASARSWSGSGCWRSRCCAPRAPGRSGGRCTHESRGCREGRTRGRLGRAGLRGGARPSSTATSPSAARSAPRSPRTGAARRWSTCGVAAARPTATRRGTRTRWSSSIRRTKGLAAMTVAVANARGWLDYEAPVARYWPEFAQNGKGDDHRAPAARARGGAGLAGRDPCVSRTMRDLDAIARLLARQKPAWPPGTRHGYHAMTIGLYMQELIRRADPAHRTLGRFFQEEIARPLQIEFYIGLPPEIPDERLAQLEGLHAVARPPSAALDAPRAGDPGAVAVVAAAKVDAVRGPRPERSPLPGGRGPGRQRRRNGACDRAGLFGVRRGRSGARHHAGDASRASRRRPSSRVRWTR